MLMKHEERNVNFCYAIISKLIEYCDPVLIFMQLIKGGYI